MLGQLGRQIGVSEATLKKASVEERCRRVERSMIDLDELFHLAEGLVLPTILSTLLS